MYKNIQVIQYNDWEHFKHNVGLDLFSSGVFQRYKYLFRGQRKAEWNLITSFDRVYFHVENEKKREIENYLIKEFSEEIAGLEIQIDSEDQILPFAQHHGLPTRLLDWSLSPYIAAFFAFSDVIINLDNSACISIWALDKNNSIWHENLGVQIIAPPKIGNIRLRNQQGKFSLSKTPFECLEKYVDQFDDINPPLIQLMIPSQEAQKACSELDLMGINYSSLFPGPEGYAKSVLMRSKILFE